MPMNEHNPQHISVFSLPWAPQITKEGHHFWDVAIGVHNVRWAQNGDQKKLTFLFLLSSAQEHLLDLMAAAGSVHVLLPFAAE